MIRARQEKTTEQALIDAMSVAHQRDFAAFGIQFPASLPDAGRRPGQPAGALLTQLIGKLSSVSTPLGVTTSTFRLPLPAPTGQVTRTE